MPTDNILLLMTDQQRWDSLGVYGCDCAHTPHLDRLGAEGVMFDACTVNNTICTPSRASLMTGKHLPGHGVYRLYDDLPEDQVLFTEHLQRHGYQTALFGKLHVSSKDYEHQRRHPHDGFDTHEFCMEGCLGMDSPQQAYAGWLRERHPAFHDRLRREGRQVLHHPREVHHTRWVADRSVDFLRRQDGTRPFFCKASIFDPHGPYQDYPLEMGERIDAERIPEPLRPDEAMAAAPRAVRRQQRTGAAIDPERMREDRFGYHASIAFADQEFGRILQTLDLQSLCLGDSDTGHEHAFCCYRNSGLSHQPNRTPYFDPPIHGAMIRDDRYKLTFFHDHDDRSGAGEGELFDLAEDPLECRNLWRDPAHEQTRDHLLEGLLDWLRRHEPVTPGSA